MWLVKMKPQNKQMHCLISPRITCNPCGNTMKISCRYHRLLIYDVKRTNKIHGMGPFKGSLGTTSTMLDVKIDKLKETDHTSLC